jgi:hypothetical protein
MSDESNVHIRHHDGDCVHCARLRSEARRQSGEKPQSICEFLGVPEGTRLEIKGGIKAFRKLLHGDA